MTAAIFIRQSAQDWGGSRYLQWRIRAILWVAVDIFSRQSITEIGCMVIAIFSRQSTHGIEVAIAVISTQSTYTYIVGLRIVVIATFNKTYLHRRGVAVAIFSKQLFTVNCCRTSVAIFSGLSTQV